jgi:DNA polymerase I-like protein with 3'-5' exonuclease and polymerase domains
MPKRAGSFGKGTTGSGKKSPHSFNGFQLPLLTPTTLWVAPTPDQWPNLRSLSSRSLVGVDCETKDPTLTDAGPGGFRGVGHVVGVSVSTKELGDFYFPLRHYGGGNVENPDNCLEYLRHQLAGEQPKVGANLVYDMEMLAVDDIELGGNVYDIQAAEALLDEWRLSYSLDSLALSYLGLRKDEVALREAANAFAVDPKKDLWRLPAGYVGAYAEADARYPREILPKQWRKLEGEGLLDAFKLESRLLRVLLEMRRIGARVDLGKAEQLRENLLKREVELQRQLEKEAGHGVDVWSGNSLANLCTGQGIYFPRTVKGNPSFAGEWLSIHKSPCLQMASQIRRFSKIRRDFLDSAIFGHACRPDGKNTAYIHAVFKSLKDDDGGAKHGRFACKDPNLQQVPKRDEEIGPLIRGVFIPEDGEVFGAPDYSAQEPRFQDHLAIQHKVRRWELVSNAYAKNPKLDRHQWVADLMGRPDQRKKCKVLNLSIAYGAGPPSVSEQLGITLAEAKAEIGLYYEGAPFVKGLQDKFSKEANDAGYITLLGGRRCRFNQYEPKWRDKDTEYEAPRSLEEARKKWPGQTLKRAFTHKALNRMVQGSCATQTKLAMVNAWEQHKIVTQMPVHDELAGSRKNPEEAKLLGEIMRDAVQLTVPTIVEVKVGSSWGECE